MPDADWLSTHTFHHSAFSDLNLLVEKKQQKNVKISLCFPTLNEEATIAKEIIIMKSELMLRYPLLDEIVVIDSGSTDRTREVAEKYGARVYLASNILTELGDFRGKGENLWKALYVLSGDIIVYIDADIRNIHHRFVYALLGPLLLYDNIRYVKAFYDRPIAYDSTRIKPKGGGRVTELVIRPLFSLFTPELTQIIQPLSGEYAGYRSVFENLAFPLGYGVETSMLLDIYRKWGMDVIAQVDLDKRVHRNQEVLSLGRMAFGIIQTFLKRVEKDGLIGIHTTLHDTMIQFSSEGANYSQSLYEIKDFERPPMIEIDTYTEKFHGRDAS